MTSTFEKNQVVGQRLFSVNDNNNTKQELSEHSNFLITSTVNDILEIKKENQPVVYLNYHDSSEKAIKTLYEQKILCVPVLREGKCIGLVDVLDCVAFCLDLYFEKTKDVNLDLNWKTFCVELAFSFQKVENIVNYSKCNPFRTTNKNESLINILSEFSKGLKRMPVLDDDNNIISILSQSDVVQYLSLNIDQIITRNNRNIWDMTIKKLNVGNQFNEDNNLVLYSCESTDSAINAYKLMSAMKVSAIAIEEDENLIGNLSGSDLVAFLDPRENYDLSDPVTKFSGYSRKKQNKPVNLVSAKPSSTLREVMELIQKERVHRVYLLETDHLENNECVGIITLTDIFSKILEIDAKYNGRNY